MIAAGDHITDERDNTDKLMIKDRKSLIRLCGGKYSRKNISSDRSRR